MKKKSFASADYTIFSILFFVFAWNTAGITYPLKWIIVDQVQDGALIGSIAVFVVSAIAMPFTGFAFYKMLQSWIKIYILRR